MLYFNKYFTRKSILLDVIDNIIQSNEKEYMVISGKIKKYSVK
jgi:hypothetical protein